VLTFETKDYCLKNYILGLFSILLSHRKKGVVGTDSWLDFPVHLHQPGDYVLIKTWKENKLEPAWKGPFLSMVLLTMQRAVWTTKKWWTCHTRVKRCPHLIRRNNGPWTHIQASPGWP
jgi:hypothetical protein